MFQIITPSTTDGQQHTSSKYLLKIQINLIFEKFSS
jgi:hypothetical protein